MTPQRKVGQEDAGPPRGHDAHFLERLSRVDEEQMDLALALYRSPGLVRALLAERAVPENARRVAIALAPGPRSAHVVVARDGAFVTCLAVGMGVSGLPEVPHERVAVQLGRTRHLEGVVARGAAVLSREGRVRFLFGRLLSAGSELAREEFLELQAIEIFFRQDLEVLLFRILDEDEEYAIVAARQRHPDRRREVLRTYWERFHRWCHLTLLTSHDGRSAFEYWLEWTGSAEDASRQGRDMTLFEATYLVPLYRGERRLVLRTLWALARAGSLALPWLGEAVERKHPLHAWFAMVVALGVIGSAHSKLRPQISRMVGRLRVPEGVHPVAEPLLDALRELMPRCWDAVAADFPQRAREQWGGALVDDISPDGRGGAVAAVSGSDGEAPSSPNATTELLNAPVDLTANPTGLPELLWAIGILGLLPAGAFYFSAAEVPALAEPYSEDAAMRLLRWAMPSPPVHVNAKPSRNEPCPCGSGRKYKHCCGAT